MKNLILGICMVGCSVAVFQSHAAQTFLINDRINDVQWIAGDANSDGMIDSQTEIAIWFNASNAAGTLGPQNPTSLAIRSDGTVIFGDQLNRAVYLLRDRNYDGDALDVGESVVAADAANLSGVSFAFPTGAAFDSYGRAHVVNAGNSFGDDGVYRLTDLNQDGDFQDIGEIAAYVGAAFFGVGNGPYAPQELAFDANDVAFLRNSSASLHGVYRFEDLNGDGRGDEPGESSVFLDDTNASGLLLSAGFGLALDPTRENSIYLLQIQGGGVDQLVLLTDLNNDNDAQDPGETKIVYESAFAGFSAIDLVGLENGQVILTDTGLNQLIMLEDHNDDGDFLDAGESEVLFANSLFEVAGMRHIDILPSRNPADLNCDAAISVADIGPFVLALTDGSGYFPAFPACNFYNADVNADGVVSVADIGAFVAVLTAM
ncbi:MAG: hypothetical protein AB7N71_05910 [Phycisphaerae bacterium]